MLDLARVTEKKAYYIALLPWLAKWGYNLVHLHLTDDQGCALHFPSHPELATPGAFTVKEMRSFIARAADLGLAIMPEIECLGHTRFITGHPRYKHLAEPGTSGFNAICPAQRTTHTMLRNILRDTAAIFDYPVIHVGLDEVLFGNCPHCHRQFGKKISDDQRFAEHAVWVHQEVRNQNRRPAMWADHVVKNISMTSNFKRDVLMCHWSYHEEYSASKADLLLDAGFQVLACPATVCWQTRLAVNTINLKNLRNTTARSLPQRAKGLVGVLNTVWCPWRYLPGELDFGLAFAGHLCNVAKENPQFAAHFAMDFYGLTNGRKVGVALMGLAVCSPENRLFARLLAGTADGMLFNREDQRTCGLLATRAAGVLQALQAERPAIRRNHARYDDVILTAEIVLAVLRVGAAGRKTDCPTVYQLLLRRALKAWSRDRLARDDKRFGDQRHHGDDALLECLRRLTLALPTA